MRMAEKFRHPDHHLYRHALEPTRALAPKSAARPKRLRRNLPRCPTGGAGDLHRHRRGRLRRGGSRSACDRLMMLQFATYSVISPEGCASICGRAPIRKTISADFMGTAERLKKLGLVDEVLKEPHGAVIRDPQAMADTLKQCLIKHLAELCNQPVTTLLDARQARLRGFGVFATQAPSRMGFGAALLGAVLEEHVPAGATGLLVAVKRAAGLGLFVDRDRTAGRTVHPPRLQRSSRARRSSLAARVRRLLRGQRGALPAAANPAHRRSGGGRDSRRRVD